MRLFILLLLAVLGFELSATAARSEPPAIASEQAVDPEALELARIMTPLEDYMAREIRMARQAFLAVSATDPDAKALETDYPGLYAYTWKALEPELRRYTSQSHPALLRRLAQIYQRHLNPAERQALRTFYLTPTGRRVLHTMYYETDATPMVDELVANPEAKISAGSLAAVQRNGEAKVMAGFGPADEEAGRALMRGVPAAKFQTVSEAVAALTLELANQADPVWDAKAEKLTLKAMKRFMKQQRSKDR